MSREYSPKEIEKKWQDIWDNEEAFKATLDKSKPKYYALVEFPYPSGQGLHVGHPRPYTAMDIVSRKKRMQGYNVLFPMGWDAFGLPTENYAIKNKIHPKIVTKNNVAHFKDQLKSLGYSFDWSREINTTDPSYYKWTQWIFLQLFKKGLAYKSEMPINWCTSCKVGLANEEVVNGVCERCGAPVIRKMQSQWMLKITDYAEKLIEGLDHVDYIEKVKVSQKNWIGMKRGFTALKWEQVVPRVYWDDAYDEARSMVDMSIETHIYGYDIDEEMVRIAGQNAHLAGVEKLVHFEQRPVEKLASEDKYGFLITNPPYGERLEEKANIPPLYRKLGERFKALDTWSLYLITSYEDAQKDIGRKADKNRKIYNGMMKTYYYQFQGPKPPRKA